MFDSRDYHWTTFITHQKEILIPTGAEPPKLRDFLRLDHYLKCFISRLGPRLTKFDPFFL